MIPHDVPVFRQIRLCVTLDALSPEALLGIAGRAEGCRRVDFWYRSGTSLEMRDPDRSTLEAAAREAPETLSAACWGMPVERVKETERIVGVTATHYVRDIWCNFLHRREKQGNRCRAAALCFWMRKG